MALSSTDNTAPSQAVAKRGEYVDVTRENFKFSLKHFVFPNHYEEDLQEILIPYGLILDRVEHIANQVINESEGPLVVACVLKGGFQFFNDLVREMKKLNTRAGMVKGKSIPLSLDFIKVKSYENDKSTGDIKISMTEDDLNGIRGKHILLVEDIIDTGATMVKLLAKLREYEPASIRVASLLLKKTPRSNGYIPDYTGFAIPDAFVVGYCLDYNEAFRDLNPICIISETGMKKYAM